MMKVVVVVVVVLSFQIRMIINRGFKWLENVFRRGGSMQDRNRHIFIL